MRTLPVVGLTVAGIPNQRAARQDLQVYKASQVKGH